MKRKLIIISLVVAALAWPMYRWFGRPTVEVVVAQRGTAISAVYGTVKVQSSARMNVRARNSGTIRFAKTNGSSTIIVGMEVKEGQLLAEILNPDLDRELAKAETDLKAGEERLRLGPPSAQQLKTSEAVLARLEKLAESQNAPASEVERVRNEVQALRDRVRAEQVELDRSIATLREQAGELRDRKARCEMRAPMEGTLSSIGIVDGEFLNENTIPFVVSSKSMYLDGRVNEEDVGQLAPKMKAVVRLYSYPQREFAATLSQIVPGGDNQKYTVALDFEKPPENLMADMTGEMNIVLARRENVLLIPTRALLGQKVFVARNGIVRERNVKTGLRNLERTEVVEGLTEGDSVVVADQDLLHPGQWIKSKVLKL